MVANFHSPSSHNFSTGEKWMMHAISLFNRFSRKVCAIKLFLVLYCPEMIKLIGQWFIHFTTRPISGVNWSDQQLYWKLAFTTIGRRSKPIICNIRSLSEIWWFNEPWPQSLGHYNEFADITTWPHAATDVVQLALSNMCAQSFGWYNITWRLMMKHRLLSTYLHHASAQQTNHYLAWLCLTLRCLSPQSAHHRGNLKIE